MAHNFQRPNLPYNNEALQNDTRYRLLTRSNKRPPTDIMLDTDFNYVIDGLRQLDIDIAGVAAGIIPGADDPDNANFLPTTDGASNISWVLISDQYIQDTSISGIKLIPGTIGATQLGDGSVVANKLATNSVTSIKIVDQNVTANKMADDSVLTRAIINKNVTEEKLDDDAVITRVVQDGAITTPKIADSNVTTTKIADANVTTAKILDANVTTAKIADGAVTLPKIGAGVLTPAASKAEQIAGASNTVYTSPQFQQNHPSAAKFWCSFDGTLAGTNAPISGYNVVSVTKLGTGQYSIAYTIPFSDNIYIVTGSARQTGIYNTISISPAVLNTNDCQVNAYYGSGNTVVDSQFICIVGYGLQ
jgi:hypothetical protein